MAKVEILLPAMGEGIIEATLTRWLVKVGDKIEEDQSIAEIATDKVDSEIPAPQDGVIEKLLFNENDVPKVGDTIAILSVEGKDEGESEEEKAPEKEEQKKPEEEKEQPTAHTQEESTSSSAEQPLGSRTPK